MGPELPFVKTREPRDRRQLDRPLIQSVSKRLAMSGLKRKRPDDEFASSNSSLVKNHVSDKDMDKKSEVRMESVYQKTLLKLRNGARNASNNNMGASGDSQAQPDQGASK